MEIGSSVAIRQALARLERKGIIERLSYGIYLYPKKDDLLGVLHPSVDDIAVAIARRDKSRIIPTGSKALHTLGLSTQVPMKVVYLTDGAPRKIKIGKQSITFKKTNPKKLAILRIKGKIIALVIQALQAIGQENITNEILNKITIVLKNEQKENIIKGAMLAPAWISKILFSLTDNNRNI
jgi:hypothetical protein